MDEFIKSNLEQIEQAAQLIKENIRLIYGYCNGQEAAIRVQGLQTLSELKGQQEGMTNDSLKNKTRQNANFNA